MPDGRSKGMERGTVLIVEDDDLTRIALMAYLKDFGFSVITAMTGAEALMRIRLRRPRVDWLFTDIKLPDGINGFFVANEFRLAYPFRPVVYATGGSASPEHAVPHSVFFRKPYRPIEIAEALLRLDKEARAMAPPVRAAV